MGRMPSAVGYQPTLANEMGALQERITSTKDGSITVSGRVRPRRRPDRPGPCHHLRPPGRHHRAHRKIVEQGIYPAVDPLESTSRILEPDVGGRAALQDRPPGQELLQRYQGAAGHHRHPGHGGAGGGGQSAPWSGPAASSSSSQPFSVAEQFTGLEGRYVKLEDTLRSFETILGGELDAS